jgi:hypothetical protein
MSEATKQSLTAVRHCEPKGWQVCWREAISPLHNPLSVKCFEGIASLTTFARNDGVGLQARNDAMGLRRLQWRNKNIVNCLAKVLNYILNQC